MWGAMRLLRSGGLRELFDQLVVLGVGSMYQHALIA